MNQLNTILTTITLALTIACSSCDNSTGTPEYPATTISKVQIGQKDQTTFYPGDQILVEAEIISTGIRDINIQVVPIKSRGWILSKSLASMYANKQKVNLHEILEVPHKTSIGTHEMVITVTNTHGVKTSYKHTFEIKKPKLLPTIENISYKHREGMLKVSADVNAPAKIAKLILEIESSAWTKTFTYEDNDTIGKTSLDFNESIDISQAPKGHYHINMTIIDQQGNKGFRWAHFDK